MNQHYLTSLGEIACVVRDRKKRRTAIRKEVDGFIYQRYGIRDFSSKLRLGIFKPLGIDPDEVDRRNESFGVLARQIPGICAEDVACHCLAQRANLTPLALAFSRDAFVPTGNDKVRRAKVPFIKWSRKGHLQLEHRVIVSVPHDDLSTLNMVRIDRIQTKDECGGVMLPEFHRSMRQCLFKHFATPGFWGDISGLYGSFLAESIASGQSPQPIWRTGVGDKDVAWHDAVTAEDALSLTIRPSSKWYYPLYLSMFLDGTFVLLETYDNDDGGVPLAKALFEQTVDQIIGSVGFGPLVIKTFPLQPDMLFVNQSMIDDPGRAAAFMSQQHHWGSNTVSMVRWFADRAIQFC